MLAELEAGIARGNERLARVEQLKRKPISEKYSAEIDEINELYNP